jgi:hypothetical protein
MQRAELEGRVVTEVAIPPSEVRYRSTHARHLLHTLGFSRCEPTQRAVECDEARIQVCTKQDLPRAHRALPARRDGAALVVDNRAAGRPAGAAEPANVMADTSRAVQRLRRFSPIG